MNVLDAAHKTVKNYPGGSESLGPRMDISPAVLRSKVNPNTLTHHLTLAEADEMMGLTLDYQVLHALAGQHGFVLQRAEAEPGTGSVMHSILAVNAAESEFDKILLEALQDNVLTQAEYRQVCEVGLRQQATLAMLLSKLAAHAKAGASSNA